MAPWSGLVHSNVGWGFLAKRRGASFHQASLHWPSWDYTTSQADCTGTIQSYNACVDWGIAVVRKADWRQKEGAHMCMLHLRACMHTHSHVWTCLLACMHAHTYTPCTYTHTLTHPFPCECFCRQHFAYSNIILTFVPAADFCLRACGMCAHHLLLISSGERERERETDRQTDRQTERREEKTGKRPQVFQPDILAFAFVRGKTLCWKRKPKH